MGTVCMGGNAYDKASLQLMVEQSFACAAEIIAETDRRELLGCSLDNTQALRSLIVLHRRLVARLHPCLGPVDDHVHWQYRLARIALKRGDLAMMSSLYVSTMHLDAQHPLEALSSEELVAELALAEALVSVFYQGLDAARRDDSHVA